MKKDIYEILNDNAGLLSRQSRSTLPLVTSADFSRIAEDLKDASAEIKRMRLAFQRIARNPENVSRQTILRDELLALAGPEDQWKKQYPSD